MLAFISNYKPKSTDGKSTCFGNDFSKFGTLPLRCKELPLR